MEKNHKSESYIIREAENIIEEYIKHRENSYINKLEERYERLKIISIALGIVSSVGILLTVIFK